MQACFYGCAPRYLRPVTLSYGIWHHLPFKMGYLVLLEYSCTGSCAGAVSFLPAEPLGRASAQCAELGKVSHSVPASSFSTNPKLQLDSCATIGDREHKEFSGYPTRSADYQMCP